MVLPAAPLHFFRADAQEIRAGAPEISIRNPAGVPDILGISWTSHDYVNHLFGPESRQSQDQTVRLDRIFAELFDYLDKRIGLQNVLITLSADHGFMNVPEYSASRNLDAGRIDPDKMIEATNSALSAKFGDGRYITAWWNPNLYVDYKLIEARKLNKVEVENVAQDFLRDYPGVEAVYTRTQMEQGMMPNTKLAKQVILAWHQKISGDIVIMNKPNWYLFGKPNTYASTHGSPWSYDTNVPLAMYGPNWIKAGKYGDSEVVDLARTIAFILNVRPPNGCEGRVLSEALNRILPKPDGSKCRPSSDCACSARQSPSQGARFSGVTSIAIIDASPCGQMTFLVNEWNRLFTDAGFGNWFADRCKEAGVPGRAHGLRKAGATIAAENGATTRQLTAVFGWDSIKLAENYTRAADQKRLAESGMHLLAVEEQNGT